MVYHITFYLFYSFGKYLYLDIVTSAPCSALDVKGPAEGDLDSIVDVRQQDLGLAVQGVLILTIIVHIKTRDGA